MKSKLGRVFILSSILLVGVSCDNVNKSELLNIEIISTPTKLEYKINDTLDLTGMRVIANYKDSTIKNITNDVSISNVDMTTVGIKPVVVSYQNMNDSFEITVNDNSIVEDNYTWKLVKDVNELSDGDNILITSSSNDAILSNTYTSKESSSYFDPTDGGVFEGEEINELPDDALIFTINKSGNYWSLSNNDRLLAANGAKQLKWDLGNKDWTIEIDESKATISTTKAEYGRILYNVQSPRFTTYTSTLSSQLILPEIYKRESVEPIYPTSISIKGNNEVGTNKSVKLSVDFVPSNTNQKNIIWKSLNENIATVTSDGVVKGVSEGNTNIEAKAFDKNGEAITASFNIKVVKEALDKWTVMLYLCGSDLESDESLATADITEILSVQNQPEDVNFIIQTGGSTKWNSKYNISSNKLGRYHVENNKLVLDSTLTNSSMGNGATLESFLNWGIESYPAEKTGVILWNHGGAMNGVCYDDNYSSSSSYDTLTNLEVKDTFESVFESNGITDKFEFIGYDACLMQVQDIADFNSNYFNYMIASEESEAGEGWEYSSWLSSLYSNEDTEAILKTICDGFISSYEENWGGSYDNDQTLSALDLSKMKTYKDAFEKLIDESSLRTNILTKEFTNMMKKVKTYGSGYYSYSDYQQLIKYYGYTSDMFEKIDSDTYMLYGYYDYGTFDVYDFLNKLSASSFNIETSLITNVKNALNDLIVYNKIGDKAGESHGLALVCPMDEYLRDNYYYSEDTDFATWRNLVTSKNRIF